METPQLAFFAAFMLGAYWLMQQAQQTEGSGGGAITTDTGEGADILSTVQATADQFTTSGGASMSAQGLDMLRSLEGFSATPYPDHKGQSIGYGHLIKPGESLTYVTEAQAAQLLAQDVAWAEAAVNAAVTVQLTQAQFDALVSFTYNVGAGAFRGSTLLKRINAGDPNASSEFGRWVYASGQVNQALVSRRRTEQSLFDGATA